MPQSWQDCGTIPDFRAFQCPSSARPGKVCVLGMPDGLAVNVAEARAGWTFAEYVRTASNSPSTHPHGGAAVMHKQLPVPLLSRHTQQSRAVHCELTQTGSAQQARHAAAARHRKAHTALHHMRRQQVIQAACLPE